MHRSENERGISGASGGSFSPPSGPEDEVKPEPYAKHRHTQLTKMTLSNFLWLLTNFNSWFLKWVFSFFNVLLLYAGIVIWSTRLDELGFLTGCTLGMVILFFWSWWSKYNFHSLCKGSNFKDLSDIDFCYEMKGAWWWLIQMDEAWPHVHDLPGTQCRSRTTSPFEDHTNVGKHSRKFPPKIVTPFPRNFFWISRVNYKNCKTLTATAGIQKMTRVEGDFRIQFFPRLIYPDQCRLTWKG